MIIKAAFQALLENSTDMMFIKDKELKYVAASEPFVKMVGKNTLEEILGKSDYDIFEDWNLADRYVTDDKKLIKSGENLNNYIEPIPEEDGHARYGSTSKYILKDEVGEFIGLLGITRDITREYVSRQHYQQELKYLFELPQDTYAVAYIDIDAWRIISQRRQNIENSTLQVCHTVETLVEAAIESIADKTCEASLFYQNFKQEVLKKIFNTGKTSLSFQYQRNMPDGTTRWVKNGIRFLVDTDSSHLCAMLTAKDIDMIMQKEQKLLAAATMDKMTMVLNREATMEAIEAVFAAEPQNMHALVMLDVDNFKTLNDTYGHQAGDKFLVDMAEEMKNCFRGSDIKGRIGGDEFFALMKNVKNDTDVKKKVEDLLNRIQKLSTEYPGIHLSGSIGVGLYPVHGTTLQQLYKNADAALYQAKNQGKNCYVIAEEQVK